MGVCDCFKRINCTKKKKVNTPFKFEFHVTINITKKDYYEERNFYYIYVVVDPKSQSTIPLLEICTTDAPYMIYHIQEDTYHTNNNSEFLSSSREVFVPSLETEIVAAIQIQTAFRAYKAKKRLHYLRVISRFQALNNRNALAMQASSALDKLHFWSKIQAQIGARRLRMKQMKLEDRLKVESKLNELQIKRWSESETETIEENKLKRQQLVKATNKRERALAYAFSHQWRANSNRYFGQAYYDLSKESWGWNWIEQWIAVYRQEDHVVVRPVVSPRASLPNVKQ